MAFMPAVVVMVMVNKPYLWDDLRVAINHRGNVVYELEGARGEGGLRPVVQSARFVGCRTHTVSYGVLIVARRVVESVDLHPDIVTPGISTRSICLFFLFGSSSP